MVGLAAALLFLVLIQSILHSFLAAAGAVDLVEMFVFGVVFVVVVEYSESRPLPHLLLRLDSHIIRHYCLVHDTILHYFDRVAWQMDNQRWSTNRTLGMLD